MRTRVCPSKETVKAQQVLFPTVYTLIGKFACFQSGLYSNCFEQKKVSLTADVILIFQQINKINWSVIVLSEELGLYRNS
jgi:hypothetical protein